MIQLDDADLAAVLATVSTCAEACRNASLFESLRVFAESGILGAIAAERFGGLGMAPAAGAEMVRTAGKVLFPDALVDALLGARYAAPMAPDVGEAIASGSAACIVAFGGDVTIDDVGSLSGFVAPSPFADVAKYLLATVDGGGGRRLALVDLQGNGVRRIAVDALDLERPHSVIELDAVAAVAVDADHAAECRGLGLSLRAAWLEANARQALQIAVEHLAVREQFGRTLISMPIVRHTLAHLGLRLENARLLTGDALARLSVPAAKLAFAYNARGSIEVAEKASHYLGAMGFTWDVPLHRYLRRIRSLVDLSGSESGADAAGLLADFDAGRSKEPAPA